MRIEYQCKFCREHRVMECDISPDCPALDLEKWKRLLVCNRCADYERARRDLEWKIAQQSASLKTVRYGVKNADQLAQLEERCRANLVTLTKQYCEVVCRRFNRPNTWEPDIVEFIMAKPELPYDVLSHFRRGLSPCSA